MPKAAPSGRALNKDITLTFGLVNIPINLYSGTVSEAGVTRHEYLPVTKEVTKDDGTVEKVTEDHPIGRGPVDKTTGELLTLDQRAQVVKKIETEYGPVWVEDSEIEALFKLEPDTLKIKTFQPQHLFYQGNYVPKTLTFIEPIQSGSGKKKGYNAAAVKTLTTLFDAMRAEGVVAVGELTTRGVPKPVILTAEGICWQVWHTDSLREQRDLPEAETVPAEVTMMGNFISTMKSTEILDLSDERSALIQNFADEKAEQGDFTKPVDTYAANKPAEATDLMALLAASVEAAKQAG